MVTWPFCTTCNSEQLLRFYLRVRFRNIPPTQSIVMVIIDNYSELMNNILLDTRGIEEILENDIFMYRLAPPNLD